MIQVQCFYLIHSQDTRHVKVEERKLFVINILVD